MSQESVVWTADSFRAAIALGPVRGVCNVCGRRHTFQYDRFGSLQPSSASRCRFERAGRAMSAVYAAHGGELEAISSALRSVRTAMGVHCRQHAVYSGDRWPRAVELEDAPISLTELSAVIALGCTPPRRELRHVWSHGQSLWRSLDGYPGFAHICPWCDESSWMLVVLQEEVDCETSRVYLSWLCGRALWDHVRCLVAYWGLDPKKQRRVLATYDAALERMEAVALRAGLRPGEELAV